MNVEISVGEVRIHAVTRLTASVSSLFDIHWITIKTQRPGEEVTFFMNSFEAAQEYASAINACNDREVTEDDISSRA